MDPIKIIEALEKLDRQNQRENEDNPWLIYVAEKGGNSCQACVKNHGKRFRANDLSRPALPVHPNCRCHYVELNEKNAEKFTRRSITVHVTDSPGIGGIRISGREDMLNKLEKTCTPGTLYELIITNHGEFSGEFELGSRAERLELMTDEQIARLKKLLAPNAIIDIRMCCGISDRNGEEIAQNLADRLECRIRAYSNQVTAWGTRPIFAVNAHLSPQWRCFFSGTGGKTFFPRFGLTESSR